MFIERSTGIANILAGRRSQRQLQRVLVQPAGRFVRMSLIKFYLSSSLADYYAGGRDRAGPRVAKWTRIVDEASDLYRDEVRIIDSGLANAMRFALSPNSGPTTGALLGELHDDLHRRDATLASVEVRDFCDLADTLGVTGEAFDALRNIVAERRS